MMNDNVMDDHIINLNMAAILPPNVLIEMWKLMDF
jgi:hypothetical protein